MQRLTFIITILLIFLFKPFQAHATLGQLQSSTEEDRKALLGTSRNTINHDKFSIIEFAHSSFTVREYVSPAGQVFGIAWSHAIAHPNLEVLLGTYFKEYQNIQSQTKRVHGRAKYSVKTSNIVVEKWGHPRNLQGAAYSPNLLPQGVNSDEIK